MENKVWALFSIENDYNQPENNLCVLWKYKPHFNTLMQHFDCYPTAKEVGDLTRGKSVRIGNTDYRIQEVEIVNNENN